MRGREEKRRRGKRGEESDEELSGEKTERKRGER